jgi:hypothetical protein
MEKNDRLLKRIWTRLRNMAGQHFVAVLELLPMMFLIVSISISYLNFRDNYFVSGYEYMLATISHYNWNYLPQCGSCVLWNGFLNGGMPAFAELHGAVLHPLVILTTLLWGVANGSKIIVLVSLFGSGVATWWLAKELGAGRIPRIWISLFGVVGGHVLGRLESGNVVLVLSVVSASLLLPMVLRLNNKVTNRRIAVLAFLMALLWLSGQGYIQLGVLLGWFPAFLFLLYQTNQKKQEKWLAFGKSFLLSIAISGLFLIPTLHFFTQMEKYTMGDLKSLQPLSYIPLNLVINDPDLYRQTFLGMDTFPYEHLNYIGWLPVLLAVAAGYYVLKQDQKRVFGALFLSILLILVFTSREVMLFLMQYIPPIENLRSFSVATSLMVPPILGLAAWGLTRISELEWPRIIQRRHLESEQYSSFSLKWLIILPILFFSFKDNISFARLFINLRNIEVPQTDLSFVQLNETQWVTPPNADWFPALMTGWPKVIMTDRPWNWKGRQRLSGYIGLVFNPNHDEIDGILISREKEFDVMQHPESLYAGVTINVGDTQETILCDAKSAGGIIDVTCDSPKGGILTVRDYQWSGWYAWMDGKSVPFVSSDWLSVYASEGKHIYSFRYRPWDIYLGAAFTILGLVSACWLIIKKEDAE